MEIFFIFCLVGRCLQRDFLVEMYFFALQNVSSELPWFFLGRNSGREIVKEFMGRYFFIYFFVESRLRTMFGRHVSSNILW